MLFRVFNSSDFIFCAILYCMELIIFNKKIYKNVKKKFNFLHKYVIVQNKCNILN